MALTPYKKIDDGDLGKALRLAGSNRRTIDRNDYQKVIKEMEVQLGITPLHVKAIDDADIGTLIVKQQNTEASDVTAPTFGTLAPVDNATGVAVSIQPSVTFSEQIVFGGSGNFSLFLFTGNVLVKAWNVGSDQGAGPGQCEIVPTNKVTLHPPAALTAATAYYITWTAGAVRDLAGNNCVAQASTTAWSFTTA
jgi:hypothetical protein